MTIVVDSVTMSAQPSVYHNGDLQRQVLAQLEAADSFYGSDVFDMTIGELQSLYGTVAFPSCLASWVPVDTQGFGDVTEIELWEVRDWLCSSFGTVNGDMAPYAELLKKAFHF